jgi:hypothetical protein
MEHFDKNTTSKTLSNYTGFHTLFNDAPPSPAKQKPQRTSTL